MHQFGRRIAPERRGQCRVDVVPREADIGEKIILIAGKPPKLVTMGKCCGKFAQTMCEHSDHFDNKENSGRHKRGHQDFRSHGASPLYVSQLCKGWRRVRKSSIISRWLLKNAQDSWIGKTSASSRSEERRVGKECRS